MRGCDCITEPPLFDLPPPPDPSLIWHLISDEKFEPAEQCSSSQFVSISDIGTIYDSEDTQQLAANILIAVAALSVLLLFVVCVAVIGRIRRKRRLNSEASKKMSSDSILAAGEHLWTYNSMKQPINGGPSAVLMYSNQSIAGSRLFHHTPTTMRSYVVGGGTPIMGPPHIPIRHSESTTLRLNPGDGCSAYHTVSVSRQNGVPPSEVYEEIAPIGTIGHMGYMTTRPNMSNMTPMNNMNNRMSLRKPPPTCRPPQPPQSPVPSDGSYEITRITGTSSDSPRERQWTEDGRESGYGTAPSLQWKSPSGSGRLEAEAAARAMTYV